MPDEPHAQLIEYLATTEAVIGDESVIVITIRPDPPNFFPHNIAITKGQAWRLARDLESLLVPFVLLLTALLSASGCGARVAVESGRWDSSSGQRVATRLEVDVLQAQRQQEQEATFGGPKDGGRPLKAAPEPIQPVAKAQATEPQLKPDVVEAKPVVGSGNTTIIFNYRSGDTHYETNIHIHEGAPRRIEERATVRRQVQVEQRPVDEQCERLAKEHEERVKRWKACPWE